MSKIKEMVEWRLQELAQREDELSEEFREVVHGLADLKVTTRINGYMGYYLDKLAAVLEISRTKLAAELLEKAISEAVGAAFGGAETDWDEVRAWADKNGLNRDARTESAGD